MHRIALLSIILVAAASTAEWLARAQSEPGTTFEIVDAAGNLIQETTCVTVTSAGVTVSVRVVCNNRSEPLTGWGTIGLTTGRKSVSVALTQPSADYVLAYGVPSSVDVPLGQPSFTITFTVERDITADLELRFSELEERVAELDVVLDGSSVSDVDRAVQLQCRPAFLEASDGRVRINISMDTLSGEPSIDGVTPGSIDVEWTISP